MTTDAWGIDESYEDAAGTRRHISRETRETIRTAMGDPPPPSRSFLQDGALILRQGQALPLQRPAQLQLEDGSVRRVSDHLPPDLPIGYHALTPTDASSGVRVIVTPGRCYLPSDLRLWGWTAQLYAARSRDSWGIGDLADLRRLTQWAHSLGAGMVMINPLHAVTPASPVEPSPYSPSSRRYLNPLYLRVEELPGASQLGADLPRLANLGRALNQDRRIDRERVLRVKQEALKLLWSRFQGDPEFDAYRANAGESLRQFAVFCVLAERHGKDWRRWPAMYRRPDSADVLVVAHDSERRVGFHEWLQWHLDRQLARASQPAPIMQDLPVGFSPDGADAWVWQDLLALDMTVGAPPDLFSATGQDWGLPPFVPHKLRAAGYEPFIQTIRAVLRHAGGLRIDHVMGLFRLWWISHGDTPKGGAYVRYPAEDLLAIVALESARAGAVVVGEDLGTVEPGVHDTLGAHDILSYRLVWFEESAPSHYPAKALAAVTTHDLPTLAGVWTGTDRDTQRRLGLETGASQTESLHRKLLALTGLEATADPEPAIRATYARLAEAPSTIVMASLEDACRATERPNLPSAGDRYPNWCLALPLSLEELESAALPRTIARLLGGRAGRPGRRARRPAPVDAHCWSE